jgi:hypothetical protein
MGWMGEGTGWKDAARLEWMCLRDVAESRVLGWVPNERPGEEGVMDAWEMEQTARHLAQVREQQARLVRPMVPWRKRRFRYDWKRLAWWEEATDTYYKRTFGQMVGYRDGGNEYGLRY